MTSVGFNTGDSVDWVENVFHWFYMLADPLVHWHINVLFISEVYLVRPCVSTSCRPKNLCPSWTFAPHGGMTTVRLLSSISIFEPLIILLVCFIPLNGTQLHPSDSSRWWSSWEARCHQFPVKYHQLSLEVQPLLVLQALVVLEECLLGNGTKCLWFVNHQHAKITCYLIIVHLFICTSWQCLIICFTRDSTSISSWFSNRSLTCSSMTDCLLYGK